MLSEKRRGLQFESRTGQNLGRVVVAGGGARTTSHHHRGTREQGTDPPTPRLGPCDELR